MDGCILVKRTFEAEKYPKDSEERARLNLDGATSEYMHSHRYMVHKPFLMSDGTPHPRQKYIDYHFRTKTEAQAKLEELQNEPKRIIAQVVFVR